MDSILLLFAHTNQGNRALADLDDAGVDRDTIRVVGDLGAPAGQPQARRHVTLDTLHLPVEQRDIFMDIIRSGGVVLAVDAGVVDPGFVEHVGAKHEAMRVTRTSSTATNLSHNVTP